MKSKFMVILLALCLLCGCALADGIPEGTYAGEWNGGAWTFTVADGIAEGEIDLVQEGTYTMAEDGSLNCQLLPHYDRYVFELCPEGYRYDADGEWRVFAAQQDGSFLFTAEDGTPGMTLNLSDDGQIELRKHWSFWTDYVHGQDPQTCTLWLGCHTLNASYEETLVFAMEDGAFTPYYSMHGQRVLHEEEGTERFELAGTDGNVYFCLEEKEGGVQLTLHVNFDGEELQGIAEDLTRMEDGGYRGELETLWLHDDGSFTLWEKFEQYSWLGSGMIYAYEADALMAGYTLTAGYELIRLEVTEEGVFLSYGYEEGHARRME